VMSPQAVSEKTAHSASPADRRFRHRELRKAGNRGAAQSRRLILSSRRPTPSTTTATL